MRTEEGGPGEEEYCPVGDHRRSLSEYSASRAILRPAPGGEVFAKEHYRAGTTGVSERAVPKNPFPGR